MANVLILNRSEMEQLLTLEKIIPVIERAFVAYAEGRTRAYPVVREELSEYRGIFGIKSGFLEDEQVVGLKAGGFWLGNPEKGLTAHQSTTVMFDPASGVPTAFMDGNHITTIRTAAVGALAARELARQDARVAAVLGCGVQGVAQAEALCSVRPIKELRAFDTVATSQNRFAEIFTSRGFTVLKAANAEEAVRTSDVVITATPGRQAVLESKWVTEGVHINAFGTDTRGKMEVEPSILVRAKVFVDDVEQAVTIGETQHAIRHGLIDRADIRATLGELLGGRAEGRTDETEITLFDATGLAFQDLIAGHLAVRLAGERNIGRSIRLS